MSIARAHSKNRRSTMAKLIFGLAYATVILAVSIGPTLAANQPHDDKHDNRGHDDRGRHDDPHWHNDGGYYYAAPAPVYAPPPVYYSPPQYYSSPGINIVLPLNFR